MFVRALVAFLVLPGAVGFLVPLLLRPAPPERTFHVVAAAPLVAGTFMLLWCVRDFYVAGKGTLAPWAPPRNLVVVGLYRWSRNPMYSLRQPHPPRVGDRVPLADAAGLCSGCRHRVSSARRLR